MSITEKVSKTIWERMLQKLFSHSSFQKPFSSALTSYFPNLFDLLSTLPCSGCSQFGSESGCSDSGKTLFLNVSQTFKHFSKSIFSMALLFLIYLCFEQFVPAKSEFRQQQQHQHYEETLPLAPSVRSHSQSRGK